MDTFLFYSGGALALIGAIIAVGARHIFHAALGLAIALVGTAGLFIPLNGELISVIQLLVYLGAVAIAIIFTLMLSPPYYLQRPGRSLWKMSAAAGVALLLTTPLLIVITMHKLPEKNATRELQPIHEIGLQMLSDYVFPFEIISLVLTVAIIAAIVLARDLPDDKPQDAQ